MLKWSKQRSPKPPNGPKNVMYKKWIVACLAVFGLDWCPDGPYIHPRSPHPGKLSVNWDSVEHFSTNALAVEIFLKYKNVKFLTFLAVYGLDWCPYGPYIHPWSLQMDPNKSPENHQSIGV